MSNLELEIKQLIISTLNLEDVSVEEIDSEAALFGEGLCLDSIDALELGVAIQKKYNITIDSDSEEVKQYFASVKHLVSFIESQQRG